MLGLSLVLMNLVMGFVVGYSFRAANERRRGSQTFSARRDKSDRRNRHEFHTPVEADFASAIHALTRIVTK